MAVVSISDRKITIIFSLHTSGLQPSKDAQSKYLLQCRLAVDVQPFVQSVSVCLLCVSLSKWIARFLSMRQVPFAIDSRQHSVRLLGRISCWHDGSLFPAMRHPHLLPW